MDLDAFSTLKIDPFPLFNDPLTREKNDPR
jgi:hypothetical protein